MSKLKVLMVDDELPIRKWFAKTFKTLPGIKVDLVGVATNGEEALTLFRETKPDVIFADIKMPIMDGLTLLRLVKQERPSTDVVMVTSYDEFAYAKEAIAQDAFDYILKTEVSAKKLQDILQRIQAARQSASIDSSAVSLRFTQEIFLNNLLAGDIKPESCTEEELNRHGIFLQEHAMFAVAFQTNRFDPDRMVETYLNTGVDHVLYYPYQKNIVVALANTACIDQLAFQNQIIFQFADKVSRCFDSPVGVSGLYYKYEQLPAMILGSVKAFNLSFYHTQPLRVYHAHDAADSRSLEAYFQHWEESLNRSLRNGDFQGVPGQVEQLMDYISGEMPGDVDMVKQFLFRVLTNFYIMAYRDQMEIAGQLGRFQTEIARSSNFTQLRHRIDELVKALMHEKKRQKPQYSACVAKAVRYIRKNYATIQSVGEVAQQVGLNSDYFCHLFKRDTGVTFSQYLNHTRMNEAIWLLNNSTLKSYEIAERIGYANQGYFSKLFKQKFKMTPYEFRTMHSAPVELSEK